MCKAIQRCRFFSSGRLDNNLPIATKHVTDERAMKPTIYRSKSEDGAYGRTLLSAKMARTRSISTLANVYSYERYARGRHMATGRVALASIPGFLLLGLLSVILFKANDCLQSITQIKQEVLHTSTQIQELRQHAQTFGKISMSNENEKERQLYLLEQDRLKTHHSIQLFSKRLLRGK